MWATTFMSPCPSTPNIRAYIALADQGKRTSLFTIDAFVYDSERDLYTCPAGETLLRRGHDHRGSYVRYAAKASACNVCPPEEQVHEESEGALGEPQSRRGVSRKGEGLPRHLGLPQGPKEAGSVWVEPLFAEAKEWHRSKRFRLRRLESVNAEALMIASGQNVKRLLAFGVRRPRRPAQAAVLRRSEAGRPGFHGLQRHRGRCIWAHAEPFSTG
jgi:hypothetical protein